MLQRLGGEELKVILKWLNQKSGTKCKANSVWLKVQTGCFFLSESVNRVCCLQSTECVYHSPQLPTSFWDVMAAARMAIFCMSVCVWERERGRIYSMCVGERVCVSEHVSERIYCICMCVCLGVCVCVCVYTWAYACSPVWHLAGQEPGLGLFMAVGAKRNTELSFPPCSLCPLKQPPSPS